MIHKAPHGNLRTSQCLPDKLGEMGFKKKNPSFLCVSSGVCGQWEMTRPKPLPSVTCEADRWRG